MLCQHCKKREATVHMVNIINGVKKEEHLCSLCANNTEDYLSSMPQVSLQNIFPYLWQESKPVAKQVSSCPTCGWSYNNLAKTGKVGCGECYHHFQAVLEPLLQRIHSASTHIGKVPVGYGAYFQDEKKLADLKVKMAGFVLEENFEEAAGIRDQIKSLEAKKAGENNGR